jgi:hypothetical protein
MVSDKRICKATNAKGAPCGANPLRPGTIIEGIAVSGDYCRQHDQDLPDSARIGGATPGAGRKPKPHVVDIIRERIEERSGEVLDALWAALKAERAVVVGNGPTAHVELVSDHPTRIAAARELLDRAYGRTRQANEVVVITKDAFEQVLAELEADVAELEARDQPVACGLPTRPTALWPRAVGGAG